MAFRSVFVMVLALVIGVKTVAADELVPYEIVPDGQQYQISLSANEQNIKRFSLYFVSTGAVSNSVAFQIYGPPGVVGQVRAGAIGSQDAATAVTSSSNLQRMPITTYPDLKSAQQFTINAVGSDQVTSQNVSTFFTIPKDACNGSKRSRYLAQITLDLSKIDPAVYQNTFTIVMSAREVPFQGRGAASIKPASDGLYKGQPIILMQTVGYGNEYVTRVTWKGNRIVQTKRVPVVKYVSYRGYGLSLALLKGLLTGGRHTFELSNGVQSYGVCLKAARERQRVNGYPSSPRGG